MIKTGGQSEELILNIIKNSNEVIVAIDLAGKVILWNSSAEKLFGYEEKEVLGQLFPLVKSEFSFELNTIITKTKEGSSLNFKTQKQTKDGSGLDLIFNTNPLYYGGELIGASIIIQQVDLIKNVNYLTIDIEQENKEHKRTFNVIRDIILLTVGNDKKTINQISTDSGVNWRTVEKHLTYLIGKKLAAEIFSSEYVRIFELTNAGRNYTSNIKRENYNKYIKKTVE